MAHKLSRSERVKQKVQAHCAEKGYDATATMKGLTIAQQSIAKGSLICVAFKAGVKAARVAEQKRKDSVSRAVLGHMWQPLQNSN